MVCRRRGCQEGGGRRGEWEKFNASPTAVLLEEEALPSEVLARVVRDISGG